MKYYNEKSVRDYISGYLRELKFVKSIELSDDIKMLERNKMQAMQEETLVTNRELSKWLALGNGEIKYKKEEVDLISTRHLYEDGKDYLPIDDNILVRPWDSPKWLAPTKNALSMEANCDNIYT